MRKVLFAVFLVATLLAMSASAPLASQNLDANSPQTPFADEATPAKATLATHSDPIDQALKHILQQSSPETSLQVMIQFTTGATEEKWDFLRIRGITPLHNTRVVPSVFAVGPARAIEELATSSEVLWVEWNSPIEQYMNQTVDTILARNVWNREVLSKSGTTTAESTNLRGDGVTVVVLDSGIDATHPDLDYNPQSPASPDVPDASDKVIYNAKLDQGSGSSTPNFVWLPLQNTDTTSGHGTHVAGTVAGNGDASADDKLGVAPNAWLIGLSMGEAVFTIDEYSGLEYVYDLSEPGSATQDAWNIRVVSNSWGPGFPFDSADSNDLTVKIIDRLSWENNVAVIFANGNDGGDGSEDKSNIFAKVPSAIGIAAANRNGVGMSDFSSRGIDSDITTWPDIAAPGVDIWSAAARVTMIGGAIGAGDTASGDLDYYYLAISGTSMATPHVAGLVAIMFQAAPSLHMSQVDEDLSEDGDPALYDPTGTAPPATASRQIHEAELILKLTADRIVSGENLAAFNETGIMGLPFDYAQGYGMINADKAVATALALQQLRDPNGDGEIDYPDLTVWDAINRTAHMLLEEEIVRNGDMLESEWDGEFAVFSTGADFPPASAHRKEIWIPAGTTRVRADMDYSPLPTSILCPTSANLRLALDKDGDGNYEENDIAGVELTFTGGTEEGAWWGFDVQGNAAGTCLTPNPSTSGPRSPYAIDVIAWLKPGEYSLNLNQSEDWIVSGIEGPSVHLDRLWYKHVNDDVVANEEEGSGFAGMFKWMQKNWWVPTIIALIFAMMIIVLNENSREMINNWRTKDDYDEDEYSGDVLDGEVLEAEVLNEMPKLPSFPVSTQNVAPVVQPLLDLGEEVVETEVVEAEVVETEVVEAEVVEAEVVEAEVVIDPLEVEFVEAEVVEADVEDDELDAFLDDF
jgi:serine protease AprX